MVQQPSTPAPIHAVFRSLCYVGLLLAVSQPALGADAVRWGEWRFHSGDEPAWASPGFDDSDWPVIRVPGDWQAQGFDARAGMGWYRVHFELPAEGRGSDLGLMLGHIFNADQVYLNGILIGAEGHIGSDAVEAHSKIRAYPLPGTVLRPGDDNVLAIRVMNTDYTAGIVGGPVEIGNYEMISMEAQSAGDRIKIIQAMIMGLFLVIGLFCVFLFINGLRVRSHVYFGLFLVLIIIATFLDSLIFYDYGMKTPFIQRIIYALEYAAPIVLLLFVAALSEARLSKWEQGAITIVGLLALLSLVPASTLETITAGYIDQLHLVRTCWYATLILTAFMVGRALQAARHGFTGGVVIAIAMTLPPIGGLLSRHAAVLPGGIDPVLIGFVAMTLLLLFAKAGRYFEMTQRLQSLTEHLTNVQSMERQRLARDLHDSLGQNLVSFQLNLKMTARHVQHPLLNNMLDEVATCIRRLDDTLRGLRPTELARSNLAGVIQQHARRMSENSGVTIEARADCPDQLPDKIKENLFNIFQEALNNAIKHARATHIDVELRYQDRSLLLLVRDDGIGFDTAADHDDSLGMLTMRERAQLINALFQVDSASGRGTSVRVEVPLND